MASFREYHRFPRTITAEDGEKITIPRQAVIRGKSSQLYDVLIAQCQNHIVVAVPFHQLAEEFFVKVDRALAGTSALYERLDITSMVIRLGSAGSANVVIPATKEAIALSVTRCHLAYTEREGGNANLKQVQMTGGNLGASPEYQGLIGPVLQPRNSVATVTPIVLGFALATNGVKKSSATTDRHGNFKIWVAPGIRRLTRIFGLLEAIETMRDVTTTTSNVPILQSKTIRDAED